MRTIDQRIEACNRTIERADYFLNRALYHGQVSALWLPIRKKAEARKERFEKKRKLLTLW